MTLKTLIRLIAVFIVMTILTCTLIIANKFYKGDRSKNSSVEKIAKLAPDNKDYELVEIDELAKRISRNDSPEIVLGGQSLRRAMEYLKEKKYVDAKKLLENVAERYEDTPAEIGAYRVLGEMKLDEIFNVKEDSDRVVKYTVKRGDTYTGIVKKFETNFDHMLLLNKMTSATRTLHPKDELLLMPLHFSLKLVPRKNQLFLMDQDGSVVKVYDPLIDMTIPKRDKTVQTKITTVGGYHNGNFVTATRANYRESEKTIKLDDPAIEIMGETSSIPSSFKGVVLSKLDMEELVLLLRQGNKVELLY